MKSTITTSILIILAAFIIAGCNSHYAIDGKVVDAVTGRPVEGAVVSVNWIRYKLQIPMGLPPNRKHYGTSECITDARGKFTIPKYLFGSDYMGVYKEGYICWSSEKIYNPKGKTHEEKYAKRKRHRVKKWMAVELVPITGEDFPILEHAIFVNVVNTQVKGNKFSDFTIKERKFERAVNRKNWGKEK